LADYWLAFFGAWALRLVGIVWSYHYLLPTILELVRSCHSLDLSPVISLSYYYLFKCFMKLGIWGHVYLAEEKWLNFEAIGGYMFKTDMKKNKFMRFGLLVSLVFGGISCTPSKSSNTKPNKIVFGIQPNEAEKDFSDFKSEMKSRAGIEIEFKNAKDYKDLIEQMASAKVDFGFFSPLNFVEIDKRGGVKVLLKKVYGTSEFYFSSLVVAETSKITSLKGLSGKRIAFVDPNSASGYMYPKLMLHNQGLSDDAFEKIFAGTHDAALKLVDIGGADAAAVWADDAAASGGAWTKLIESKEIKFTPKVLAVSSPIPNDALVVREAFYNEAPDRVLKFMDALISISEDSQILKELFGADRLVTATSRHYESVRDLDALVNKESTK
jgi:phosphonate transport system substrate-binding protein